MLIRLAEGELTGDAIHNHLGNSPRATSGERHSLQQYADSDYSILNDMHRGLAPGSDYHRSLSDDLDYAIHKQPIVGKTMQLHRGVNEASKLFGEPGSKVGRTFSELGFMSTSSEPHTSEKFQEDPTDIAHLILHTHPEAKALSVKNTLGHDLLKEDEVLLPRDSTWKVHSDNMTPNGREIHLHQKQPFHFGDEDFEGWD
jgi:hypothetical protein